MNKRVVLIFILLLACAGSAAALYVGGWRAVGGFFLAFLAGCLPMLLIDRLCRRWKYYRISLSAFAIGAFSALAIFNWMRGRHLAAVVSTLLALLVVGFVPGRIKQLRSAGSLPARGTEEQETR